MLPIFRLLHASFGTVNVNAYLNNDFGTIVFPDIGFGEISAFSDIDPAPMPFTVTDVLNSGAPIHEEEIAIGGNSKHTVFLAGAPGALSYLDYRDDARPLETSAQVRITNPAISYERVNVYMQSPGTVIDATTPIQFIGLPSLLSTDYMHLATETYEITITQLGEFVPLATPITIDIVNGDIVDIAILDTVDPMMLDLFIFSSTLP